MKRNAQDIASLLCLIAGWILVAEWFIESVTKHEFRDMFSLAVGIYFIGKGMFVREIVSYLHGLQDKKAD